jgi:hypothetical protein
MASVFEESRIRFEFSNDYQLQKFDNTGHHQKLLRGIPHTKAIDFVGLYGRHQVVLIEVKNFRGVMTERISVLAEAVGQKVRDTAACLVGAARDATNDRAFWKTILGELVHSKNEVHVIFWLEENNLPSVNAEKLRLLTLTNELKRRCKWLNAKVLVVSASACNLPGITAHFLPTT